MKPDFTKSQDGLIPAIIQDSITQKVLMLGYMDEEAFQKTQLEKRVTFFSRSKGRLWTKGEESGHFLETVDMTIDCDNDTILVRSKPAGPVCHNGWDTCFNERNKPSFLFELQGIIEKRKSDPLEKSYISSLFASGLNKIAQKVGEEAVELIIESKDNNNELFREEAADLLFHYLILLNAKGLSLDHIIEVLEKRNVKKT